MLLDVLSIGLLARSAANQVRPLQEDAVELEFGQPLRGPLEEGTPLVLLL